MASECILLKGGGGADLDVITAVAGDVLLNKVIVDKDGNPLTGTMPNNGAVAPSALGAGGSYTIPAGYHNGSGKVTVQSLATMTASGDATAAHILSGKKAYVDGNLITGKMTDHGAQTPSALNCGGSYTIPAGYHNGSGKVTANSLANQTKVDSRKTAVAAAQMLSGYQGWVNGSKISGSMANQGAKTASYTPSTSVQSYTIPAGYHNGSGKITINAIPSKYVDLSAGASFFKNGVFGPLYTYLGITNKRPDCEGCYPDKPEVSQIQTYLSISWDSPVSSAGTTIEDGFWKINSYYGGYSVSSAGWCTKKLVNLTNVSKINFKVKTTSGDNSATMFFALDPDGKKGAFLYWSWAPGGTVKTYSLDVSSLNSPCLFGMYRTGGNTASGKYWYIQEVSFT